MEVPEFPVNRARYTPNISERCQIQKDSIAQIVTIFTYGLPEASGWLLLKFKKWDWECDIINREICRNRRDL